MFRAVLASAISGDGRAGVELRTFRDLDWGAICRALARRCAGPDATELASELGLLATPELAERRRQEIDQAASAVTRGLAPPLRALDALGEILLRAKKQDLLTPQDLLRVARGARAAEAMARWSRTANGLPLVVEHAIRLADVSEQAREIERCIDPAGEVTDSASPELGPLRRRVNGLRDGIVARLERIVRSPRYEGILQDDYITLREGRYVLPVRAGERGDFPGIVHGQSSSGQTLFIEPRELVEPNNALRMAQLDVDNEVRRILTRLSRLVYERADELEQNHDTLVYLDLTFAAAKLAVDLDASLPTLSVDDQPVLRLSSARHPVLALRELDGELTVVPNTVELGDARGLVISGPNTGGKTVTLKTVGLIALMTRAGLPVPVAPGSCVPWFEAIHTDIGDEQGVERDLSTFSAHVANIAGFWGSSGPGSLVLLDELFAGTDPGQGAALGAALVSALVERGATVIVTTHLERLKTLGMDDGRFAVASVGFDVDALRPTYALRVGLPGSSYAFRIAARLGLSPDVVARAERLAGQAGDADRERIIEALESEHARVRRLADDAEAARAEAKAQERAARDLRARIAAREASEVGTELEELKASVRDLRAEARRRAKELRSIETPDTAEALENLRRAVDEAREAATASEHARRDFAQRVKADADTREHEGEPLRVGSRAWVSTFKRDGEIVEIDVGAGRAVVQIGPIRTNVATSDLAPPRDAGPRPESEAAGQRTRVDVARLESNTLDVRGERVDDAIERLDAMLDRASRAAGAGLFVIHGHGTGALKRAVRAHLGSTPYRLTWRAGESGEGGDGVTVVAFE